MQVTVEIVTKRQIRREKEIMRAARQQGGKNRTVPISLYWKLLDAADYALDHGYKKFVDNRAVQEEIYRRQKEREEIIDSSDSIQ